MEAEWESMRDTLSQKNTITENSLMINTAAKTVKKKNMFPY
jgi:hypothetical protein